MAEITVTELNVYPVKGCQSLPVEAVEVTALGFAGDRGFAIWADGKLVEQLHHPQVAALGARWDAADGTLTFRHAACGEYRHAARGSGERRATEWVLDRFDACDQGDEVAAYLSDAVGAPVRLVRATEPWKKNLPLDEFARLHGQPSQGFQSASPVSLANAASLRDLGAKLETPVPMDRFRMNLVVDGLAPWAEDGIDSIGSDAVGLLRVTHCERCPITTTDQRTGVRVKSDLLQVLRAHRYRENRFGSGLLFGAYMAVERGGVLRVGDRLRVS